MTERDIKYTSWVISVTSIMYGIVNIITTANLHHIGVRDVGVYYYVYYILFLSLVLFGFSKILGLLMSLGKIKKTSIIGLTFVWGFIWTSSLIESLTIGYDEKVVTLIPVVVICLYIAFRGEYSDA